MMSLLHPPATNPLHLLDDFLTALSSCQPASASANASTEDSEPIISTNCESATTCTTMPPMTSPSTQHEQHHDLTLRVAFDLFGNHSSLLENALTLLEGQEQYQSELNSNNSTINNADNCNVEGDIPIIRKIQARRSGREAILIRKQRTKSTNRKSWDNATTSAIDNGMKKEDIMHDYYLCLLGRDRPSPRPFTRTQLNDNNYCNVKLQRRGIHCTCRSFFQNITGGRAPSKHNNNNNNSSSSNHSTNSIGKDESIICKHILAAILMPQLLPWSEKGVDVDIVEDRMFAKMVMRASIG
jgi:hypothetical protein